MAIANQNKTAPTLDQLRQEIIELKSAINAVETAPAHPDEMLAELDRLIIEAAEKPTSAVNAWARQYPDREALMPIVSKGDSHKFATLLITEGDMFPGLAFLFPDEIREKYTAIIKAIPNPGLKKVERAAKIAELHGQLYRLEVAEELIVREMEAQNMIVKRRDDVSGWVVFAVLPGAPGAPS